MHGLAWMDIDLHNLTRTQHNPQKNRRQQGDRLRRKGLGGWPWAACVGTTTIMASSSTGPDDGK